MENEIQPSAENAVFLYLRYIKIIVEQQQLEIWICFHYLLRSLDTYSFMGFLYLCLYYLFFILVYFVFRFFKVNTNRFKLLNTCGKNSYAPIPIKSNFSLRYVVDYFHLFIPHHPMLNVHERERWELAGTSVGMWTSIHTHPSLYNFRIHLSKAVYQFFIL